MAAADERRSGRLLLLARAGAWIALTVAALSPIGPLVGFVMVWPALMVFFPLSLLLQPFGLERNELAVGGLILGLVLSLVLVGWYVLRKGLVGFAYIVWSQALGISGLLLVSLISIQALGKAWR